MLNDGRADPTVDNEPLRVAARCGHVGIVKLLLADERVDPTAKNCEALWFAIRGKCTSTVEVLLNDNRMVILAHSLSLAAEYSTGTILAMLLNNYRIVAKHVDLADLEKKARAGGPAMEAVVRQWRADADLL